MEVQLISFIKLVHEYLWGFRLVRFWIKGVRISRPLNSHYLVVRLKILSVISRSHYRATKSHYFTKTSQDFKQNLKISLYSHELFL